MIWIGEKCNSSIPATKALLDGENWGALQALLEKQAAAGAEYLDLNTALCRELPDMERVIALARETGVGLMPDSPDPRVLEACLPLCAGRKTVLNSCTAGQPRLMEAAAAAAAGLVLMALPKADTPEARLEAMSHLWTEAAAAGIPPENRWPDVRITAAAADDQAGKKALETVRLFREAFPGGTTVAGLSNISFGLPHRRWINAAFRALLEEAGLAAAILEPGLTRVSPPPSLSGTLRALLTGEDEDCMDTIRAMRRYDKENPS